MIVSIDIGTSYSSISMLGPDGKAQSVDIGTGVSMFGSKFSVPSAVFVEDEGGLLLGQAAMNSRMRKPQNFRDEFKRNLGENIPILLGGRSFLPENLYTEFFRHMKNCAEQMGGESVELAYLTCPASYGELKRNKLIAAAEAAEIPCVELVDEPIAAAMYYHSEGYIQDGQNLMIFDFGGATFDVTLLHFENGKFRRLTNSVVLPHCGGIDIDRMVFQDMLSKVDPDTLQMLQKNPVHNLRFVSQLSELAVKCKHHLSTADQFTDDIILGWDSVTYQLSLEDFNRMIAPLVGQTIQTCRQVLEDAGLKLSDLSAVLLVGGTSRVRLVREMVEKMAGDVPVHCAADLELAVSQGALNYRSFQVEDPEPAPEELYQKGQQLEQEKNPEAAEFYRKAAEQGYAPAQYALGECYQSGFGVEEDEEKAVVWYRKAAEQDNADGQYGLGLCYLSGLGIARDEQQGIRYLEKAKNQGHAGAAEELKALEELKAAGERRKQEEKQQRTASDSFQETQLLAAVLRAITNPEEGGDSKLRELYRELGGRYEKERRWEKAFESFTKAANLGDGEAQCAVARCYAQGIGTAKNENTAIACYRKAANNGSAEAQFWMGEAYREGRIFRQSHTQAASWYRDAAKQGHQEAQAALIELGFSVDTGMRIGTENQTDAQFLLSQGRQYAQKGLWNEAFIKFEKAADLGDPDGCYSLANCYEKGLGTEKNRTLAAHWYQKATELRNGGKAESVSAGTSPEELYRKGQQRANAGEWEKAFALYTLAAEQGHTEAQCAVGNCHEHGLGTAVNGNTAVAWYRKAANNGSAEAQFRLGQVYEKGMLLPRNVEEAIRWYQKAADRGHKEAKTALAQIRSRQNAPGSQAYAEGLEFARKSDWYKAIPCLRQAAEMGHADAQYLLGSCYEYGHGVFCDLAQARQWYEKAAGQNHPAAVEKLKQQGEKKEEKQNPPANENTDEETAQFHLGRGRQYAQEGRWSEAFLHFFKAGQMGDPDACYSVANCYEKGLGTEKNSELSSIWYQRATEYRTGVKNQQKSAESAESIHRKGQQYARDGKWEKAFSCYKQAAEQGYADAQYHLGSCYQWGSGVAMNGVLARLWYEKAAKQGHTAAADKLKQLNRELTKQTPEQIIRKLLKQMPDMGKGYNRWSVESTESKTWLNKLGSNLKVPNYERKLAACDRTTSWFSSGKEGWILTDKGIISSYRNYWVVSWEEFARSKISWEGHLLVNNNYNIKHLFAVSENDKPFFNKLHEELRKQL